MFISDKNISDSNSTYRPLSKDDIIDQMELVLKIFMDVVVLCLNFSVTKTRYSITCINIVKLVCVKQTSTGKSL